ncbi:hypothetical protein [Parafrankia soli]|uniref:hypothetical protein n=1 Tax=Parafrankia soli TaxID=2599596 RepID=UPI001F51F04F|nr:hypothetical protein [Parafrankia soli]
MESALSDIKAHPGNVGDDRDGCLQDELSTWRRGAVLAVSHGRAGGRKKRASAEGLDALLAEARQV